MSGQGKGVSRWCQEAFRANLTVLRENVWHLMMCAICGVNSCECIAIQTQDGLWEKMCGGCSQVKMDGFSGECFETWTDWGVMYGGTVFLPALSERRFAATVPLLWPRPMASDSLAWTKCSAKDSQVSIWKTISGGHAIFNCYRFMWNGLNANQTAEYTEMMMGFPVGWTDLNV